MSKLWLIAILVGAIACDSGVKTPEPIEQVTPNSKYQEVEPEIEPTLDADGEFPLATLRSSLTTKFKTPRDDRSPPQPPKGDLDLVQYPGPLGRNFAYQSMIPQDGKKHPAVVWMIGGFYRGISQTAWAPAPADNDQSGRQYRQAGVVTLYPATRGYNANPGDPECFLGEVDDIIAAGEYLKTVPGVDPDRVYLGGHSTGATLAVLAAASSDTFRAVFAFEPTHDPQTYKKHCPSSGLPEQEQTARAPVHWMSDIRTPTWIFGGTRGYVDSFKALQAASPSTMVNWVVVPKADHFSLLSPGNVSVANAIIADTGPNPELKLSPIKPARP